MRSFIINTHALHLPSDIEYRTIESFKPVQEPSVKKRTVRHFLENQGAWLSRPINHYRLEATLKFAGKKILDTGCGSGGYVSYLRNNGYHAFGTDLLKRDVQGDLRSHFCISDTLHLPFVDNAFDTVLAFEVIEHIHSVDAALSEIRRVTKENIIISVPDCDQNPIFYWSGLCYDHWVDRTHVQAFNRASLKKTLENIGFSVQFIHSINPVNPDLLFFYNWGLPMALAKVLGRLTNRVHINRRLYMTLLAVARK